MNGPPILATLPSGLSDTERDRPRLLVYGVARRLLTGYWPCAFSWDPGEAFDGMIIGDAKAAREAEALLRQRRAWLAPIVDLTAQNLWFADYFADSATPSALRSGVERALDILASLGRLPTAVLEMDDRETALLARVFSRGQRLEPTYDGAAPQLLRYGVAGLIEQPAETAERLGQSGWFSRTFFDRLHFCPTCNSSRLSVREECSACRSTDLHEESIVNHFRCAHQAMERQFKQGEMLICPKCRQRLRHFGVDYDRPGTVTVCRACGHVDAEAVIGFLCIDCGARNDAAVVPTRDWYAYALTDIGERRLLSGDFRPLRTNVATESEAFRILSEHWTHMQARYGRPATMLRLVFTRAAEVRRKEGARVLALATKQAVEIVRGELLATDFMAETPEGVLIVLPETDARAADVPRRRLLDRIASMLAVDLGADIAVVQPRELLAKHDVPA